MTLDEAIKHCEEVAQEKENEGKLLCQSEGASIGCLTCAEEHRQLAEWLKDYKRLTSVLDKIRAEIMDCLNALDEIEKIGINIYLPNEISGRRLTYQQCLEIIDKYKAESEGEND